MCWKRAPKVMQFRPPRTSNIELALKREHDSHFFSMTPKSHSNELPNAPIWHPKITTIGSKGHPVTILDPLGGSKEETYFWTYLLTPKSYENDSKKWGGLPQGYVLYLPSRTLPSRTSPEGDPLTAPSASLTSRRFPEYTCSDKGKESAAGNKSADLARNCLMQS